MRERGRRDAVKTDPVLTVPDGFAAATRAREGGAGAQWVSALPALVERLLGRWDLRSDDGVLHGYVALVVPVRLAQGVLGRQGNPRQPAPWPGGQASER